MDASNIILTLIKDDSIKNNLNPLIYYALKLIYSPHFSSRSTFFGRAIKKLYDELGNNLNIQLETLDNKLKEKDNNILTFDMTISEEEILKNNINNNINNNNENNNNNNENNNNINNENKEKKEDLNVSVNRLSYNSINKLMKANWKWCIKNLINYDDEYILDKSEKNFILDLIIEYIRSNVHPKDSPLMLSYNIFVSSVELIFCFKLIQNVPKFCFFKEEEINYLEYKNKINNRIEMFLNEWIIQYPFVYKRNKIIKELLGEEINKKFNNNNINNNNIENNKNNNENNKNNNENNNNNNENNNNNNNNENNNNENNNNNNENNNNNNENNNNYDINNLDINFFSKPIHEPHLPSKYPSFTKLIKDGPFYFDIEEISRQICIIDQDLFSTLTSHDLIYYLIKKEPSKSFMKIFIREKQLQSYILILIIMHNNLENKKILIQNFIQLAYTLKLLGNNQTSNTIIITLGIINISKKKLLWKIIEKKYRDIYIAIEKDFHDMELGNSIINNKEKLVACVPNVRYILSLLNNIIISNKNINNNSINENNKIVLDEFKNFYGDFKKITNEKYLFFKINPLYDFFVFGFLEIFKPKRWNLKSRFDFSAYIEKMEKLDQLLNYLTKNIQTLDL